MSRPISFSGKSIGATASQVTPAAALNMVLNRSPLQSPLNPGIVRRVQELLHRLEFRF
jgi:hypothetical protein